MWLPRRVVVTIVALPCISNILHSQSVPNTPAPPAVTYSSQVPTFGAGHDYIQMLAETVNPANGSVSLRIPIALPKGRGIAPSMTIGYDSAAVNVVTPLEAPGLDAVEVAILIGTSNSTSVLTSAGVTTMGWTVVAPSLTASSGSWTTYDGYETCYYTQEYVFTDSLGQPHAFPDFTWDGSQGTESACPATTPAHLSTSMDGTVQAVIAGGNAVTPVAQADGTTYTFVGPGNAYPGNVPTAQLIEDRNGNQILFPANEPSTDTLGRQALSLNATVTNGVVASSDISVIGVPNGYHLTMQPVSTHGGAGWLPPTQIYGGPNQQFSCNIAGGEFTGPNGLTNLPTALQLPDGTEYKFDYDPNYAMLSKITYPNGAYVTYTWGMPGGYSDQANGYWLVPYSSNNNNVNNWAPITAPAYCNIRYALPVLLHREVSYDGSTIVQKQDFSYTTTFAQPINTDGGQWSTKTTSVNTSDQVTGLTYTTVYNYVPSNYYQSPIPVTYGTNGAIYSTFQSSGTPAVESSVVQKDATGRTLRTTNKTWDGPARLLTAQTILENGQTSETDYSYAANPISQLHETDVYDYGPGVRGSLIQKTITDYNVFGSTPNFTTPVGSQEGALSLLEFPSRRAVYDGYNNLVSETDFSYDQTPLVAVTATQHDDANFGIGKTPPRANVTTITKKCFPNCSDSVTTLRYDTAGQVVSMTDPNGQSTGATYGFSYVDNFVASAGLPSQNTDAYLTQITYPDVNGIAQTVSAAYGYDDGLVRSTTDANSNATKYCYYTGGCSGSSIDPWLRLTEIDYPDGGIKKASYVDTGLEPTTTNTTVLNATQAMVFTRIFDGMGHEIHTQLNSNASGATYVDEAYDGEGRLWEKWNPYYDNSDSTYGFTQNQYDALGRSLMTINPDKKSRSAKYVGAATYLTDENSIQKEVINDALGRMTDVYEDVTGQNLHTKYSYTALGDLNSIIQNGLPGETPRLRTFTYDSLSRLLISMNPEAGSICYGQWSGGQPGSGVCQNGYDLNGNIRYKTDARNVTISYTYDSLNRLYQESASNVAYGNSIAPSINYTFVYDQATIGTFTALNPIGKMVDATNNVDSDVHYSYDAMGRVVHQEGWTPLNQGDGVNPVSASYDFAGNMTALAYPDGRVVSQEFGSDGRLTSVNTAPNATSTTSPILAINFYAPSGQTTGAVYGSGTSFGASFNNRFETTVLAYTNGPDPSQALWWKTLAWTPNGNLLSSTDVLRGVTRQFTYDNVNRLTSAQDTVPNAASSGATGQLTNTDVFVSDNLVASAGQMNGSGWTTYGGVLTPNADVAPDGSTTAGRIDPYPNAGGELVANTVLAPSVDGGGIATFSLWARVTSGTLNTDFYLFDVSGGEWQYTALAYTVAPLTTTWQQITLTGTTHASLDELYFTVGGGGEQIIYTPGQNIEIWGADLEMGPSGATTNILPSSQQLVGGSWGFALASPITTQGSNPDTGLPNTTAPDNSNTATTVAAYAGSTDSWIVDSVANPSQYSGQTVTGSVYLCSPGGKTTVNVYIVNVGANGYTHSAPTTVALTPAWQRVELTAQNQAALTELQLQIGGSGSWTNGQSFEVWGAQMTVGTSQGNYVATLESAPNGAPLAPSGMNETYSYDSFGNIQQFGSFTYAQSYDAANRMSDFLYDAAGNLLSDRLTNVMTYDANERIATLNATNYSYLPTGERVGKSGAGATDTIYFGGRPIARLSGGVYTDLIYGPNGLLAEIPQNTGVPTYRMLDQLGTEVGTFDSEGKALSINDYAPFGQQFSGSDSDPFKLTGKERDVESGLDYFGARYYASAMGRFMSPDWASKAEPVPYAKLEDPQSLNLYAFVRNNPFSNVDIDGHVAEDVYGSDGVDGFWDDPSRRQNAAKLSAQQQSSSSVGGSFWHHVGNLFHGHSWNYVQTTVTDTETYTVQEPQEGVTAATDAAGLIGMAAPTVVKDLHLGPLGAGASILNDPSRKNILINLIGLTDLGAAPMATAGAFNDFLTWGVQNGHGRVEPKAYNSDQLTPTLPTQDGGCEASGLPSC